MGLPNKLLLAILWHTSWSSAFPKTVSQIPSVVGRMDLRETVQIESCPNLVYCQGELLDTVQRQKLFTDSKQFVDMSQINDENITLANFEALMAATGNQPNKTQIEEFVAQNFEFISETEEWTPQDFNPEPKFLEKIPDFAVKVFAKQLVSLWPQLGRKITDSVREFPDRHSILPVPEGFIVPGGRFREIYYWDSYWIVKGLLISEMTTTVRGILTNFAFLVKEYGMIPNGSRLYYLNRSQPPMFAMMVNIYMEYTDDLEWLKENIEYIEAELEFWLANRTLTISVSGTDYELAHYGTDSNTPRPESYAEDVDTCAYCSTEDERRACYSALKTAAETGWDFSVRWIFDEEGGIDANLSYTDSHRVIPVDLNAILCKSFNLLSGFYEKLGNSTKQLEWSTRADQWQQNIEQFLYNDEDGIWYDYDYNLATQRKYFFASNFVPLWTESYDLSQRSDRGRKAVEYVNKISLLDFAGGIPTTLVNTGEQWDLPNAWPPLQEFAVLGLYNTGEESAQVIARQLAERWINANLQGYIEAHAMYEKYDAINPGQYGGGGEYEVQLGFGWSNGVALSFIDQFSTTSNTTTNNGVFLKARLHVWMYFIMLRIIRFL